MKSTRLAKGKMKLAAAIAAASAMVMPVAVWAVTVTGDGGAPKEGFKWELLNPLKGVTTIHGLLEQVISAMILFVSPIIVIMLIYSGFLYVQSGAEGGEAESIKKAHTTLKYTIIGAAVILGAKGILLLVQSTLTQL